MAEYEYYIQDETEELNKRVDDAFTELDTQRNRMSGLTKECYELKQELLRLQEEQKSNLLQTHILIGVLVGFVILRLVLLFI